MRIRPRLLPLVAVAAAAASLAPALGASASSTRTFDLRVGTKFTPGKATARGAITFSDTGRTMRVTARVKDLCPADGYSANFYVAVTYRDGSKNGTGVIDDRGCTATGPKTLRWTSLPSRSRIAKVTIDFYEHHPRTMQIGDFRPTITLRP